MRQFLERVLLSQEQVVDPAVKLESSKFRRDHLPRRLSVLQQVTDATGSQKVRPCARCDVPCGCAEKSHTCACRCSSQCALAPQMLSSDPDYPLEPAMVPLSYELNAARLGHSCWSCEGHSDADGKLSRVPRLWFYAEDLVTVNLLAVHVQQLEDTRQLLAPWRVMALVLGQTKLDCPAFSLEPLVTPTTDAGPPRNTPRPSGILAELRRDLTTLSQSLGHRVRAQALKEIRAIQSEL